MVSIIRKSSAALAAAIIFLTCPALAAEKPATKKPSKTNPDIDIFDVKTQDLPSKPASKEEDFPMPDFNDKVSAPSNFTDDLFNENTSDKPTPPPPPSTGTAAPANTNTAPGTTVPPAADTTATPSEPAIPAANFQDDLFPPEAQPNAPATTDAAAPAVTATPTTPEAPVPPATDSAVTPEATPTAATTAEPVPAPAAVEAAPEAVAAVDPAAPLPLDKVVLDPALSPSEVNDYTNLKQHLYNFLNNFATSQKAKEGEKTTEVAANEAEVTPSSVGDYKTITNEDYQNLDNYLEPPPGTAPAPDTAPPIPAPDTAAATPLAPEIPVAPVTPPPGEVASAPTVPNSPSPPPAPAATDPIPAPVAQIPASPTATPDIKPVELTNKTPATTDPEKKPAAPANKISEEDLSYMQAMDKKRQDLPKNKQLPEDAIDTIKTVTPGLVTDKTKNLAASDPEKINIKRGKETAAPVEGDDGIITGSGNTAMSARPKEMAKVDRVINKKLEKAYRALLLGQLSASVAIYKEVLDKDPNNKDALFGLGTAYHKNSQFDQARNIYTKILEKEPNNKEVLNNFLVLVAEEAPNDALIELQKLERINSDFSPIPAQIAMIYLKLNNPQKAERYLRRAVILSPENITYKYNLAITSDRLNNHRQAIRLYRQIIEAVAHGAVIPGSITSIEDRLSFLEEKVKDE